MALPSPSNSQCWRCREKTDLPQCSHCNAIQPLPEGLNAFVILGLPATLILDEDTLRQAVVARSRVVHPDRFVTQSSPQPEYALQWSTALNRANQAVKTHTARTRYLLDESGSKPATKPPVPIELAETYFELQDALQEGGGKEDLLRFQAELQEKKAKLESEWKILAAQFDAEKTDLIFKKLETWLVEQKYLSSMLSDIESRL